MRRLIFAIFLCIGLVGPLLAESTEAFEKRLQSAVADEGITVVHLWATWCPNCWREHEDDGWKRFIEANPEVKVIFVSIWGSKEDDRGELAKYGLGEQPNFEIWRHPNQARRGSERMTSLLGNPVTWLPTTWVYRGGTLRYAINYGEVRFPMLQQMVDDSRPGQW